MPILIYVFYLSHMMGLEGWFCIATILTLAIVQPQVSSELILEQRLLPSFDVIPTLSTLHQWFVCTRLLDPYLTPLVCLFLNAHYHDS